MVLIKDADWENCWNKWQKCLNSPNWREVWQKCGQIGDTPHIFWECPMIKVYWEKNKRGNREDTKLQYNIGSLSSNLG